MDSETFASSILFALALRVTSTLHEGAHAAVAAVLGARPTVSNFTVHVGGVSNKQGIAIALAGPLFSLLQGILTLLILPLIASKSGPARMFGIWLGLHGLANFFGYLLVAAFTTKGDVSFVLRALNAPVAVRFGVVAIGVGGIILTGKICSWLILPLAGAESAIATEELRRELIVRLAVLPWVVGAMIVALSGFPFRNRFGTVYELTSGAFTLAALRFGARSEPSSVVLAPWQDDRLLWLWGGALVLVLAATRLTLGRDA
jgi:hypothetical protein